MSQTQEARDRYWMWRALALARKGLGFTQPNPMVGAIVLGPDGKIVGKGFHPRVGEWHAEIFALDEAGERSKGGTLYVTLEPCTHTGRTPPCIDRVLASGVRRVVIAMQDPNPLIAGTGITKLKEAGIDVSVGCREEDSKRMNLSFFMWMEKQRPFVIAKAAVTLDGKIGVVGRRHRISDPLTDRTTMRLRANAGVILIGVETLLTDNSRLTVRDRFADRRPLRAIVDGRLRTPKFSRIFREPGGGSIWILCREDIQTTAEGRRRYGELTEQGAKIVLMPTSEKGYFAEADILRSFQDAGVTSVLIEGGSRLFTRFAQANLIDQWILYLSSQILGDEVDGRETIPLLEGGDYRLEFHSVIRRGRDLEIEAVKKIN